METSYHNFLFLSAGVVQLQNKHGHIHLLSKTIFIQSNTRIYLGFLAPIHAAIEKENGTELGVVLEYPQNQLKE